MMTPKIIQFEAIKKPMPILNCMKRALLAQQASSLLVILLLGSLKYRGHAAT